MNENINAPKASNGMATASLVLGIVSIVFSFFWPISVICGILAIVLGIVAKGKIKADINMGGSGAATGGLITGVIGIILSVIFIAIVILFAEYFIDAVKDGTMEDRFRELENYKNL